jgi:type IV pilus assembly protein PilQ
MKKSLILISIFLIFSLLTGQENDNRATNDPDQMITISRHTSLVKALKTIETFSEQYENRKIINLSSIDAPIDLPINKLHWKDALLLLVRLNDLAVTEKPGSYLIEDKVEEIEEEDKDKITIDSQLIKISGILFKADKSFTRSLGIDWSTLVSGEVNANVNFTTTDNIMSDVISLSATESIQSGNVTLDVNTLIKAMESNQKGSVIARPNISVLSGKKGYIQVGQNFSIKTIDEEGNTTDEFFETGIILQVEPEVIKTDQQDDVIYLNVSFEKSTATPGEVSTVINQSKSTTELLLFDGEEAMISGLYDTDTVTERIGIPLLKDLPWWFLGLRYLFGYNSITQNENELIVILKAELVRPAMERLRQHKKLPEQIDEQEQDFENTKKIFEGK